MKSWIPWLVTVALLALLAGACAPNMPKGNPKLDGVNAGTPTDTPSEGESAVTETPSGEAPAAETPAEGTETPSETPSGEGGGESGGEGGTTEPPAGGM